MTVTKDTILYFQWLDNFNRAFPLHNAKPSQGRSHSSRWLLFLLCVAVYIGIFSFASRNILCYHIHTSKYKNSNSLKRHTTIFWNKGKYCIVIYISDITLLIWSSMSSSFFYGDKYFLRNEPDGQRDGLRSRRWRWRDRLRRVRQHDPKILDLEEKKCWQNDIRIYWQIHTKFSIISSK